MALDFDDVIGETSLEENDESLLQRDNIDYKALTQVRFGSEIVYSHYRKNFWVTNGLPIKGDEIGMGISVGYDKYSGLINVLYKGFLYEKPIDIPYDKPLNRIDTYVLQVYNNSISMVKEKMPRIRRFKRLNLMLPYKSMIHDIYEKFDTFMDGYSALFGTTASQMFKAKFVTTPFYVNYEGKLKIYKFETNEYYDCDTEGGNFIPYFTYMNDVYKNTKI